MQRPPMTPQALRVSPLIHAIWADTTGIESVPGVLASAHPAIFRAWRPPAQWTADIAPSPAHIARLRRRHNPRLIFDHERASLPLHRTPPIRRNDSPHAGRFSVDSR